MRSPRGVISVNRDTFEKIEGMGMKKGNVLETARIAGIMAAKKTAELIPMCHPLNISHAQVDFFPDQATASIRIVAESTVDRENRCGDGSPDCGLRCRPDNL